MHPPYIIVMGVSGCGKTTVGEGLAAALDAPFLDGDDYHPPANKQKMGRGEPLTDDDRWPWLEILAEAMRAQANRHGAVAACSALKRAYRDALQSHLGGQAIFCHLVGDRQTILDRMALRQHEYMPPSLLDSQIATLEPLQRDEIAVIQNISDAPETIVRTLKSHLDAWDKGKR